MEHKKFSHIGNSELRTPSRKVRYDFDKPYLYEDFHADKKLAVGKRRNKVLRTIVLTKYQPSIGSVNVGNPNGR